MEEEQQRHVWGDENSTIVARWPIYKFSHDDSDHDDIYGRTIEEMRERDHHGFIPDSALWALQDDWEAQNG